MKLRVKRCGAGQELHCVAGSKGGNRVKAPGDTIKFVYEPNPAPNNPNVPQRSFTVSFFLLDDDESGNANVPYWPFVEQPTVGTNGVRVDAANSPLVLTLISNPSPCKYEVESGAVGSWPAAEKLDPTVIISPGRTSSINPAVVFTLGVVTGAIVVILLERWLGPFFG